MKHCLVLCLPLLALAGCTFGPPKATGPSEQDIELMTRRNQGELSFAKFPAINSIAIVQDGDAQQHALTKKRDKVFVYVSADVPKQNATAAQVKQERPPERARQTDPRPPETHHTSVVVHFEFGKSELNNLVKGQLKALSTELSGTDNVEIVLTGHTDSIGSDRFNFELGLERAKAVQRYLVSQGLAGDKTSIRSEGETSPIDSNKTAVGRANNRRVTVDTH